LGDKGLEDHVCEHFGRAPTFTIVDLEEGTVKVIRNFSTHFGGLMLPAELLAKEGVKVVLCRGVGPKAVRMMRSYGLKVFVGASGKVKDVVDAWRKGLLPEAGEEGFCLEPGHKHYEI